MAAPEIFTAFDDETGQHVIMVRSHGRSEPFGPRIFRQPPHPVVSARHDTETSAKADAAKIRTYLASLPEKKRSS